MRTDVFYQLADAVEGDKYFDMYFGQQDHGTLGHLIDLYPDLWRGGTKNFPDRVCSALAIPRKAYIEIFYPKLRDANWRSSTQKGEKANISAAMCARYLRRLAVTHEEVFYEQKNFGIAKFVMQISSVSELFDAATLRKMWNMARYPRNVNVQLIQQAIDETKRRVENESLSYPYVPFRNAQKFNSTTLAVSDIFFMILGWPSDNDSVKTRLTVLSDNLRLPISELRRMFMPMWDNEGVSGDSGPWNKLAWISPEHMIAMLEVLIETGEVSWRMARRRMEERKNEQREPKQA